MCIRDRHHPKVPVETDARIMERHFGVLQGKVYRGPSQKPDDTEGIESREAYVCGKLTQDDGAAALLL